MKFSRAWRNTLLQISAIGALTCTLFPIHSNAREEPKDVSKMIGDMRGSIVSAKVVIIRANLNFFSHIDENELNRIGCLYLSTGREDLDSLLDIVTGARIVEATPFFLGGKMGISARIGIYLTKNDGTTTKLLFVAAHDGARAEYGWLNEDISVRAMNEQFAIALREWAARRTPAPTELCDKYFRPLKPASQAE